MSQHILVTGGAGYIGSHVCKLLSQRGLVPITFDNFSRGNRHAVKFGPLVEGDIQDRTALAKVFKEYQPIAVMHFAALAYVGESMHLPELYYRNNVQGTLNLLSVMLEHDIHKFIFSSTCAVYGHPQTDVINESHPCVPINPYGRSKLMIETALKDYFDVYQLASVSLRYFNAAGADPDLDIGEEHHPETHLIPNVLKACQSGKPVQVFGDDYATPDGTCIRDYIHVWDIARAHVLALQLLAKNTVCECINLGTGHGNSVLEIIDTVRQNTGKEVSIEVAARRQGDPEKLVADASYAKQKINWQPERSSLAAIIKSAWDWQQKVDSLEAICQ